MRSFLSKARTNAVGGQEEGEGYICPSCHEEQGSADDLEAHHAANHAHLCPHCLKGLPTPDDLVHHYATEHAVEQGPLEAGESQVIQDLKSVNINLSCEVRLLEQLLTNKDNEKTDVQDEPISEKHDGQSAVHQLSKDEVDLLSGNSIVLLEHCQRQVDNLEVKATVAKQVLVETQQRLEDLEKEEMVVGKRLQRLVSERREIIRKGELELTKSRNEVEVD